MTAPDHPVTEPLRIAVVGHTNAGKTSLLRTLTRNVDFGEVSDRPGTTRHAEAIDLRLAGATAVRFIDTPGLEDSVALLEYLNTLQADTRPARVRAFLQGPEAREVFEQEAKVLRALLEQADAAMYVVDTREPVLPKHRAELEILTWCARPVMPVLNFVRAPGSRHAEWQRALLEANLHAQVQFDAVAPFVGAERTLYGDLATLLPARRAQLGEIVDALALEAADRQQAAARVVAEALVDVAAMRRSIDADEFADPLRQKAFVRAFQDDVRRHARRAVDDLLAVYAFRPGDAELETIPELAGRWEDDLFSAEALRAAGVRVGTGAAAGAAAGMGIDLVTGGLTLGAAAALGALAGGLWQTVSHYGERLGGKLRGYRQLSVDDAIVRLLALRSQRLLEALERRGHAAVERVSLAPTDESSWRDGTLPGALAEARIHPEWSAIGTGFEASAERSATIAELSGAIHVGRPPIKE